jgi:hypothetical protein
MVSQNLVTDLRRATVAEATNRALRQWRDSLRQHLAADVGPPRTSAAQIESLLDQIPLPVSHPNLRRVVVIQPKKALPGTSLENTLPQQRQMLEIGREDGREAFERYRGIEAGGGEDLLIA